MPPTDEPAPPGPATIERYRAAHHADVVELVTSIQTREFALPITLEQQPDLLDVEGFFRRGAGEFWVALEGARVIGTIGLVDGGDGTASLRKMFVRKEARGAARGVAAALLDTLVAHARRHGIHTLYLGTTAVMASAHRFYAKQGFVEVARETIPPTVSFAAVDVKFYKRALA